MKILVDETMLQEQEWFTTIPININGDQTAFASTGIVKELIDNNEKTIIFTIPKSLSGQYEAYQLLVNENVVVLEGTALFSETKKVQEILKSNSLKDIANKINALNKTITYEGIILDARQVSLKNRIGWMASKILTNLRIKVAFKFKDGKWSKKESSLSGFKLFKKALANKKEATLIISEAMLDKVNKYLDRLKHKPTISIVYKTRVMEIQSGKGFIAVY